MVTVSDVEGSARLLRPRDDDALRAELRVIAAGFATPAVIFGGPVSAGTLQISETLGTRTAGLRGLLVSPMLGLGGRAMTQGRPQWVEDYASAQTITHDYDRPVINEGLRSIIAVPVVVDGGPRAIMYAAFRQSAPLGGRLFDILSRAGNRLAAEITIRDEVDRRVELIDTLVDGGHAPTTTALIENIREIHTELRALLRTAPDSTLATSLHSLADKLAGLSRGDLPATDVTLSGREIDVLTYVGLGYTNAMVAQRLSITPETVKHYLRGAMGKLDARSRVEAVSRARRLGLLP
ncbi:LuxR C-terminal-related transcriptional regulator [Rhodococcus sp. MSC1_016]|uniref:LuxR C-terminal-related transcriptional regulator n=1 Tax=Rhodococcus sp. MSC1_016 TaxID=2909266 RepID=UPI0020305959|nr:LuxR C-terminal-related transcriptional regulator [Rhodococcus sp. MSC1_016]